MHSSRRTFLQTGLAAFGTLSLPGLLRLRADAPSPVPNKRTAIIVVWLRGGQSHLDTWDPKPDASSEYRGPFKTIDTSTPGLRFTELLPRQAKLAHKFALV